MSTLPSQISSFELFLTDAGFTRVGGETLGRMDYRRVEFASPNMRVQVIRDRGYWNVTFADTEMLKDTWYDLVLFTYLLGGKPQPKMAFEEQLAYAKDHWPEILDTLRPNRRIKTHLRLGAAKKDRATQIFTIWPTAIRDLESFLSQQGLRCIERKEPRSLYDWMSVCYVDWRIAVQMSSQNGWHIMFADQSRDINHWYAFKSVRKFIQWPEDKAL